MAKNEHKMCLCLSCDGMFYLQNDNKYKRIITFTYYGTVIVIMVIIIYN